METLAKGKGMMERWPHQIYGVRETLAAIEAGQRRVCLTSPTGGGKTTIASDLIDEWLSQGFKVVLYTNRKMLVEQTSRVMTAAGHEYGVRAAGHRDEREQDFQISSIQTENSRVLKRQKWALHEAQRVIIDEAHLIKAKIAVEIIDRHIEQGAAIVGLTATPLDLGDIYKHLIIAGTTSELRACGALVPCFHYGCDEPDLKSIGKVQAGVELTEKQQIKAIMRPGIFGRVLEHYRKLNPEGKPAILFGPGVAESIWFAEQFVAAGITAAHIDGENVWINGKVERSNQQLRGEVLAGSKSGDIQVLCNRFVLREGIDAPWLEHGIFATVFGSLQSYLQSGGRLLRAYLDLLKVTIQDHGGHWWRHGSLNADREWNLKYTSSMVSGLREERLRTKKDKEPVRCPRCGMILMVRVCPGCQYEVPPGRKSRPVVQSDGTLREMTGDIFKPRRISQRPDAARIWERMYYRAKNADMTFRQAEALYAVENNWGWPAHSLPKMPTQELDWFLKVSEVPVERLTR